MSTVTLYTRPGCHLCETVDAVIRAARPGRTFQYEIRNILDDPALYEQYKHAVPVITIDGREIARHRLDPKELAAALTEAGD